MEEIAPGLRRWTSWHDHWEEDVGSVAVETADGLVLIDPLDPPSDLARPRHVLITVYWHARSAERLKARFWAPSQSQRPLRNRGVETEFAELICHLAVSGAGLFGGNLWIIGGGHETASWFRAQASFFAGWKAGGLERHRCSAC